MKIKVRMWVGNSYYTFQNVQMSKGSIEMYKCQKAPYVQSSTAPLDVFPNCVITNLSVMATT